MAEKRPERRATPKAEVRARGRYRVCRYVTPQFLECPRCDKSMGLYHPFTGSHGFVTCYHVEGVNPRTDRKTYCSQHAWFWCLEPGRALLVAVDKEEYQQFRDMEETGPERMLEEFGLTLDAINDALARASIHPRRRDRRCAHME